MLIYFSQKLQHAFMHLLPSPLAVSNCHKMLYNSQIFFGLRTNLFVINLLHLFNADRAWAKIDHKWGVMHFKQFYAEQAVFLKHFHFI